MRTLALPVALGLLFAACGAGGPSGAAPTAKSTMTVAPAAPVSAGNVVKSRMDALSGYGDYDGPSRSSSDSDRLIDPYGY